MRNILARLIHKMVNPSTVPSLTFNNGQKVPVVGLGTWQSSPGEVYTAVREAIKAGYRHLDCAHIYQNEAEVGQAITDAIKAGEVTREELFVTSKIWPTYYRSDRVPINAKKILAALQLDYVNLLLVHWPQSFEQRDDTLFPSGPDGKIIEGNIDYLEAYKGLEALQDQGLTKSIGISNFTVEQVKRTLAAARIKPVTNQIELHPYLVQKELVDLCKANDIILTAYSPLGNPGSVDNKRDNKDQIIKDPVVIRIAEKYGKNVGQILIKYQVALGNLVVPKSVNPGRIASNIDIFDFELTPEEVAELSGLDKDYRSNLFLPTTALKNYPFPSYVKGL